VGAGVKRSGIEREGLAGFGVVYAFYGCGDHLTGVFHGGDGFVVAAADGVGADLAHLLEHLHAVFEVADAAALVVAPGDGDFDDGVFELAGDEQDLGVEAPALDVWRRKIVCAASRRKALKPHCVSLKGRPMTLRVTQLKQRPKKRR
jgi:hypothetical protein